MMPALQIFWNPSSLRRLDLRMVAIITLLMGVSILVIASHTAGAETQLLTPKALAQLRWFAMSWVVYLFFAGFDYNRIREGTWILYALALLALIGLFFTSATARVHRWYMIPVIHVAFQPSEVAKLVVVFALSWFLERRRQVIDRFSTGMLAGLIVAVPFVLIYKQPDLGTALVLWPITLVMFYIGGIHPLIVRLMTGATVVGLFLVFLIFSGVLDHEGLRPIVTRVVKDYQYERLNPNTHHHWAATTSIRLGGIAGQGWKEGSFSAEGWLPAAETDSVYPSLAEEFGLIGMLLVLALFGALIYCGFRVTAVARDPFGRLLAAGISVYIAMHVLTNIAMMCGLLPITGVPLLLVTYGGSSVLVTMAALGLLQSIYTRRFMF
jgi:rod shape determining protein RodA